MPRQTKLEQLEELKQDLTRRLSNLEVAVCVIHTYPRDGKWTVKDADVKGASYTVEAFGLTRLDGGAVRYTFKCKGQRDSVRVHRTADFVAMFGAGPLAYDADSNGGRHAELARQVEARARQLLTPPRVK